MMRIIYAGLQFNVFLKWEELTEDISESAALVTKDGLSWYESQRVMPWLNNNCKGGFVPFSDFDSMFPDEMDEFTYTIDIAGNS